MPLLTERTRQVRVMNGVVAGTTNQNGSSVDMSQGGGFRGAGGGRGGFGGPGRAGAGQTGPGAQNMPGAGAQGGFGGPPGMGNQGAPGSDVAGWAPDLVHTENRLTLALLVKI